MTKTLIVYGTRYGAAAKTAEIIADAFRQEGLQTRVVNAKEEKVKDISEYDLVVVGSGIQINKWTGEPEDFLKKFQKELVAKKLALFVCCGSAIPINQTNPEEAEATKQKYLDAKAAKYNLHPVALGFFGGIYDYNQMPWWSKRVMEAERPKIAAAYKETQPGVYDARDMEAIRLWVKNLAHP